MDRQHESMDSAEPVNPLPSSPRRAHGGADAQGAARFDFSTCANAAGPCPQALAVVQAADPTRYPDPASTAVRRALAALHAVEPARVLLAASASEFIQRITAVGARLAPGAVQVPRHAYGDYAAAASAWGRAVRAAGAEGAGAATVAWWAEPSSPLGQDEPPPGSEPRLGVLDAVYAPLRLQGTARWGRDAMDRVFVLHSPNKALGLTGLRGAYAIAPTLAPSAVLPDAAAWCAALEAAAPSWPLSAQADAMLRAWATETVQAWVRHSLQPLAAWKAQLQHALQRRGFTIAPSVTHFFVVHPPRPVDLQRLRSWGVAVHDAGSFGLPGAWRVSAQPPAAQAALLRAVDEQFQEHR